MQRTVTLDIHNYQRMYTMSEAQVTKSEISQANKDAILRYRDACLLQQTCGKVRLIRVMGVLLLAARGLRKDFSQVTREDVQALLASWMNRQPPYSAQTLGTYKAIIKRFFTWLTDPAGFSSRAAAPPMVAWITTHVRTKDKKRLQRNELLLPAEIEQAITTCQNPRDKAFLAVLWETGGRIAEIGNLQLKHVTKTDVGYTLDVTGKTGQRTPLIVSSAPLLTRWLNNHPFPNDPEAPLWVHYHFEAAPRQVAYATIRTLVQGYFRRIGITKRIYPHLFRHSRATFVLASGLMTEAQAKAYFGWTPNSDQLATYAHLLASDANAAILRENNLVPAVAVHDELRASKCYRCGELNASNTSYCQACNAILDLRKAHEHQQLHTMREDLVMSIFQLMAERGLIDEAVDKIHAAGLGAHLKHVAKEAEARLTETPQVITK